MIGHDRPGDTAGAVACPRLRRRLPTSRMARSAREFGIPAVANLPGILGALSEGERTEVDGHRGRVSRLRD